MSVEDEEDTKQEVLSQLSDIYYNNADYASLEQNISPTVVEALQRADQANSVSIVNVAQLFQSLYGRSEEQLTVALRLVSEFFCACDSDKQLSVFYVIHDFIQREPKARMIFLRVAFPDMAWIISTAVYKPSVVKAVQVWRERGAYTPMLCDALLKALECQEVMNENASEFERRLDSLSEMLETRGAKDEQAVELLHLSDPVAAASHVMAASNEELQEGLNACKDALSATRDTLLYAIRLAVDFNEAAVLTNLQQQRAICIALKHAALGVENEPISEA